MSDDPRSVPPGWEPVWPIPKVTMAEMFSAMRAEADRIIATQKALIASGCREKPDLWQLKKALSFHRAEAFFVRISPFINDVNSLVERLRERGPRR